MSDPSKNAKILIWIGVIMQIISFAYELYIKHFLGLSNLIPFLANPFFLLSIIFLTLGLIKRKEAGSEAVYPKNGALLSEGNTFRFLRRSIIVEVFLWIIAFPVVSMLFMGGSFYFFLFIVSYYLALPLTIICAIIAYVIHESNLKKAVLFLKIPFYYMIIIFTPILITLILF